MNTDVAIVGGGPVGLAMAHLLAGWGVRSVVLELRSGPTRHPRATLVNTRTMEILRQLGLADRVRRTGASLETMPRVTFGTTLAGPEVGRIELVRSDEELMRLVALSPVLPAICAQNRLEAILADALAHHPSAVLLAGHRAEAIEADARGVLVRYAGPGGDGTVAASYAVLAEGLHGTLRRQVGIEPVTAPPLGALVDVHFIGDLEPWIRGRESALYWVMNERVRGVVIAVDPARGEWLLEVPFTGRPDAVDHHALIADAVGASVRAEIRSARTWSMGSTGVTRWRDASGRVFVAGDAAHTFPPTGGFGMNTGIQDAHNLAWKLAAALHGWAGRGLLSSYEEERRPVAEFNARQSEHNAVLMRDFLDRWAEPAASLAPLVEQHRPHFDFAGQALGFRYGPAGEPVVPDVVIYHPSTVPGARAPHAWLDGPSGRLAVADFARTGFALFTPAPLPLPSHFQGKCDGTPSSRRTFPENAPGGVPVAVVSVGDGGWCDASGAFARDYRLSGREAVLVRPDGHVAARLPGADPDRELADALHRYAFVGEAVR